MGETLLSFSDLETCCHNVAEAESVVERRRPFGIVYSLLLLKYMYLVIILLFNHPLFTYGLKKKDSPANGVIHMLDFWVPVVASASSESRSKKNHDRPTNKGRGKV